MSASRIALAAAFSILAFNAPRAQENVERYTLEKTDKGYVRMDKQTGAMSICEIEGSQMICRMGADERTAFEGELDAMTSRIEALEKKVAALESGNSGAPNRLPNDEELEQTFTFMEKFFRRFMGIAKDLEQEYGTDDPRKPVPDKT